MSDLTATEATFDGKPNPERIAAQISQLEAALQKAQANEFRYREALELASVRLEILTGRMRGCHEDTGNHELLDEAEMFCREAKSALETRGHPRP